MGARPGIVREGEHLCSSWGDPPRQGLRVLNYLATIGLDELLTYKKEEFKKQYVIYYTVFIYAPFILHICKPHKPSISISNIIVQYVHTAKHSNRC